MKKNLLLIIVVSIFTTAQAQIPSSCVVPPVLANDYSLDVKQLAVKRLFALQSPDTALVRIPQHYIDTISGGLAAIVNATAIPERDSVFNLYCVHNLNPFDGFGDYDGFLVKVDTNFSWTSSWQNMVTLTGDALMDTILVRYDLTISNFYNWSIGSYAVIMSDSIWNNYALIDSLELVPGVLSAEQNSLVGVAGKIEYGISGSDRFYDFYFEYQDCFDGCDAYRKWSFKVDDDCAVEYLGFVDWCFWGVGQCPLTAPVNCNTFTAINPVDVEGFDCTIAPNPSSGRFECEWYGLPSSSDFTLEIYNLQGEKIYHAVLKSKKSEIDLNDQESGMYFMKIHDGQFSRTKKIVLH